MDLLLSTLITLQPCLNIDEDNFSPSHSYSSECTYSYAKAWHTELIKSYGHYQFFSNESDHGNWVKYVCEFISPSILQ